jgi:hypothetical protein
MKRIGFFALVFMIIAASAVSAQTPAFNAGGSLTLVLPRGEFRDNLDGAGFGLTGYFAYRFPQSPVLIGASFGFSIYGSETYKERLIPGVPVWVDVTTTNALINGHLFLRLQPERGSVQPYVDGLLGLNFFSTDTRIDGEYMDEAIASSNNLMDAAHSYGFGCGLLFRVWQSPREVQNKTTVFVDLGMRYLKGGQAEYLKKGGIEYDAANDKFVYDILKSTTDYISAHIGVSVNF